MLLTWNDGLKYKKRRRDNSRLGETIYKYKLKFKRVSIQYLFSVSITD